MKVELQETPENLRSPSLEDQDKQRRFASSNIYNYEHNIHSAGSSESLVNVIKEVEFNNGRTGISKAQSEEIKTELGRLAKSVPLNIAKELVSDAISQLLMVNNSQGAGTSTCGGATVVLKLIKEDPARFARMLRELAVEGKSERFVRALPLESYLTGRGSATEIQNGVLAKGAAGSLLVSAFIDYSNGESMKLALANQDFVSVGGGKPPEVIAGIYDSWAEKLHKAVFDARSSVVYVDDSNRSSLRERLCSGALNNSVANIWITNEFMHQVVINRYDSVSGRVFIHDTQISDESARLLGSRFSSFESTSSGFSISVEDLLSSQGLRYVITTKKTEDIGLEQGDRSEQIAAGAATSSIIIDGEACLLYQLAYASEGTYRKTSEKVKKFEGNKPEDRLRIVI